MCEIVTNSGAEFIKTSTGFSTGGATFDDVALMKKYVGKDGLSFGIDTFGKSAPYKEIYKHFGLTSANIARKSKRLFGKKI